MNNYLLIHHTISETSGPLVYFDFLDFLDSRHFTAQRQKLQNPCTQVCNLHARSLISMSSRYYPNPLDFNVFSIYWQIEVSYLCFSVLSARSTEDGRFMTTFYYYSVNHQSGFKQRNTFSKLSYIFLVHQIVLQIMLFCSSVLMAIFRLEMGQTQLLKYSGFWVTILELDPFLDGKCP